MLKPIPTTRFVLEPSLVCNILCKFCYHYHRKGDWPNTVKTLEQVKAEIDAAIMRGNNYMDITGGEPTIYPHIFETLEYAKSRFLGTCIITNGLTSLDRINRILDIGIDDWLVSRHGLKDTHNFITNNPNTYDKQVEFLNKIKSTSFRFNCVINKFNQTEIYEIARQMSDYHPRIVNFINFNPHHSWKQDDLGSTNVIADLRIVEPLLNKAIEYLEDRGIGVNVRYYPMCRIAEDYRKCICNDLQVMFDPYEWDYSTTPKAFEAYKRWGVNTSNANEEKGEPCCNCDLQNICGGANKHFHRVSNEVHGEVLTPVKNNLIEKDDIYFYRKDNGLTLVPR